MNQDIKNLIGLTYEENGKDYKIIGIKEVTGEYITLNIEEMGLPEMTLKNNAILNIGHGNTINDVGEKVYDPGAIYKENEITKIEEHQWNKDFVNNYIVPECKRQGVPYKVIIQSERFSKLAGEINKISTNDDVIVSFHLNSAGSTATGVETFYYPSSNKGKELAQLMLNANLQVTGLKNRGIKPNEKGARGHALFQGTKGVVTLLETGFISNTADMKVLKENKQKLAENYVSAIKEYLTKYNN